MSRSDSEQVNRVLVRSVPALLACEAALPTLEDLAPEQECVIAANERGYFLPDEEELVLLRYTQYLAVRSALIQILTDLRRHLGRTASAWRNWPQRMPVFIASYAAGCLLHRAARRVVALALDRPVVWKKLDEECRSAGLPRKSFTRIYREYTRPRNLTRLLVAHEFYARHCKEVAQLADDPVIGPAVSLLQREEPQLELGKREALKRRAAYRWFSFLRRHRSAWKLVMFGLFAAGGRAVADLAVPGIKTRGAAKRMTPAVHEELLKLLQPGDVVVTRHDDAMSNLFLPGYWPHAALFIGEPSEPEQLAAEQCSGDISGPCFLEAKKDGVRVRPIGETLAVDELLVLRPPITPKDLKTLVQKGLRNHAGKPYDFVFDFRTADRLACTEVVYRTYHGAGPVRFELREVGGRLCLPAEAFLDQAMACGFELVACAGVGGSEAASRKRKTPAGEVLEGEAAHRAFASTPRPEPEPKSDSCR